MDGKILIVKHVEKEGPGLLEAFFKAQEWDLEAIELAKGERLPESFDDLAAVVMLGGPMNVYEEEAFPFLKDEDKFIRKAIVEEIPFLGICLGGQLLSKACLGRVDKSPVKEIGWYTVELTHEGQRDMLFTGLPKTFKVFQWHEDTFDIPSGGVLLAQAKGCRNQAFKIGNNAYGLQFHMEVTEVMIEEWMKDEVGKIDVRKILTDTRRLKQSFESLASRMFINFKRIVESSVRIKKVMKLFVEDERKSKEKKTLLWWSAEEHALLPWKA